MDDRFKLRRVCATMTGFLVLALACACDGPASSGPKSSDTMSAPPEEGPGAALWLEADSADDVVTLRVRFESDEASIGPRVAEHFLVLSENLVWESTTPGAAAEEAQKQVISRTTDAGVRVVMLSSDNLNALGTGVLYELHLRRTSGEPASIHFDVDRGPLFAPAEALDGLRVGESLQL